MRAATVVSLVTIAAAAGLADSESLVTQARQALQGGEAAKAVELASKAIAADAKDARPLLVRAQAYLALKKFAEAAADCTKALEAQPKEAAVAYDIRGIARFKAGDVKGSVEDFEKYLEAFPKDRPQHWRLGISLYYVGRFADGRDLFTLHQTVNPNDVENAVWKFLCQAKAESVDAARKNLMKIDLAEDRRVPMKEVYELFAGKAKPADVIAAANQGEVAAGLRKEQRFYAHLYTGLYLDAIGQTKDAVAEMTKAAEEYPIGHYMWDVARVHLAEMKKAAKKE